MTDETEYNCPYCGQRVKSGESHYCYSQYFIPLSQEVAVLNQILEELKVIEQLLRDNR